MFLWIPHALVRLYKWYYWHNYTLYYWKRYDFNRYCSQRFHPMLCYIHCRWVKPTINWKKMLVMLIKAVQLILLRPLYKNIWKFSSTGLYLAQLLTVFHVLFTSFSVWELLSSTFKYILMKEVVNSYRKIYWVEKNMNTWCNEKVYFDHNCKYRDSLNIWV